MKATTKAKVKNLIQTAAYFGTAGTLYVVTRNKCEALGTPLSENVLAHYATAIGSVMVGYLASSISGDLYDLIDEIAQDRKNNKTRKEIKQTIKETIENSNNEEMKQWFVKNYPNFAD
jgi:hypothetical protein